ncbi:MAG: hypothetical protein EAX95_10340 [Candidatus Thorarchaeota archaeon]|nr:hypothetical protein [Candidatus Thorarchaeota archaeon]
MKRVLTLALIVLMILVIAPEVATPQENGAGTRSTNSGYPVETSVHASASGIGGNLDSEMYFSRTFTNLQASILNTYENPSTHQTTIDLSGFHEPGWALYRASFDVANITAELEREALVTSGATSLNFKIWEYDTDSQLFISNLTQGFYNQPHIGALTNYSVSYITDSYDPGSRGTAYFMIVSDYTDATTALTTPAPLNGSAGLVWVTISGENAILAADTTYYMSIDGTELHEDIVLSKYPEIYWEAVVGSGTFLTKRFDTAYTSWPLAEVSYEAFLNYSYTPWNTTAGAPLTFSAETVGLTGNSRALSGLAWEVPSSSGNLTSVVFDSNQSLTISYDMTLWYRKATAATTTWDAPSSGGDVYWNATAMVGYPTLFGTLSRFMNITIPMDWTANGLYNSTSPSIDYGNYLQDAPHLGVTNVTLSSMTNGIWTLTSTGFNYITSVNTYDASDDTVLISKASILVDMDVNATVENALSNGVTTGDTNLTILHEGTTAYTPATETPIAGLSHFLWDVSTAADNGTYTIELFWTNGTEAGYRSKTMVVYYPTGLDPASYLITADTDDSFLVSVQLDDDFNSAGIDAPDASVTYSFLTTINASLTSDGGGQWTTIVDTTGLENGVFTLNVYAEGFAIENQSIAITVTLSHQTYLQLSWLSSTFDWTESDVFSVDYRLTRNDSLIPDATQLTIVIDSTPLTLQGDNGTYWIAVNNTFDLGLHTIFVNVSKTFFNPASDAAATFTITEASTSLVVGWSPANVTIEYTGFLNLTVDYTFAGGDVPSASAEVNVTIDGRHWDLTYTGTEWVISISAGELGIGFYSANIIAWLYGFQAQFNTTLNINVTASSGIVVIPTWFSETTDYVTSKVLQLNVTFINGTAVVDASVTATMAGTDYFGVHIGGGIYNISLGPLYPEVLPLGLQNINILVGKYGFDDTILSVGLTVNAAASSLLVVPDATVEYYDGVILVDIYYTLLNTSYIGGDCTFDIEGQTLSTIWQGDHWRVTIQGDSLGVGTHHCTISTSNYGFENQTDEFDITINAIPTLVVVVQPISFYVNSTILVNVTYTDNRTSAPLTPDDLLASWAGQVLAWETVIPGTLRLTIQSNALHNGSYSLDLTVNKTGYVNTTTQWIVYVNPVPTSIAVSTGGYVEWENETAVIVVFVRDDFHDAYVYWASVNVTFEGIIYETVFNGVSSQYIVEIYLGPEYAPGEYTLTFEAQAVDCVTAYQASTLTIRSKTLYTLELDVDEEVTAGGTLGVTCILTHEGTPVNGMGIIVYARFNYSGVLSDPIFKIATTTADGTADVNFNVPGNATFVILWAEFEGSRTEWAITTQSIAVGVIPAPGLLEVLFAYLRDWRVVLVLVIASVSAAVIGVYRRELVPKRKATTSALERQLGTFNDLQSLQHFLAVFLDRGTCVFYHPFGEARIQADLISGFIAAITSVYGEIKGTGVQGQLEEVNYQGLKLNSYSGRFVIGILIVEGDMTPLLRERLQFFVEMFEDQYEADLDGWTGVVDCFDPEWIVSSLHATFNYYWVLPHHVEDKVKLKGNLEKLRRVIKNRLDERKEFLIADILPYAASGFGITEAEAFDMMLHLADLGAITPISIHTVLQRQGLGLANGENGDVDIETAVHDVPKTEEPPKAGEPEPAEAEETAAPSEEPEKEEVTKTDEEGELLSEVETLLADKEKEKEDVSEEDKFLQEVEDLLSKEKGKDKKKK